MSLTRFLTPVALCLCLIGCGRTPASQVSDGGSSKPQVIDVIAKDYAFQLADSIPSGWTTIRFRNEGAVVHFFLLNRLPDGVSFADYVEKVGPAFDQSFGAVQQGKSKEEAIGVLVGLLPEWYAGVRQMGGSGFVSGGGTEETTMLLGPGSYVLECYIKTEKGEFHSSLGMVRPLTVTDESSGGEAPVADVDLTLRNYEIVVDGAIKPGLNTFAVHFAEHPELGLGNDVHLARLEEGVPIEKLIVWMDWMELCGLQTPAPARFVGGTQEMPVGSTAFFTADLEPGRYVLLAESSAARGMVHEFRIE
ncbi:MAG: hypothetical protein R3F07_17330 [Opitutaceae bacterium]